MLPENPRILCMGAPLGQALPAPLATRAIELGVALGGGRVSESLCISAGEAGFIDAIASLEPARRFRHVVTNAFGDLVLAEMLYMEHARTVILETAAVCGGAAPRGRGVMDAGSGGFGELLLRALTLNVRRIIVGAGITASSDGGLGMLMTLQDVLIDDIRSEKPMVARDLEQLPALKIGQIRDKLSRVHLDVFCSVGSTLTGPRGAAYSHAKLNGASPLEMRQLDELLDNYADVVERQSSRELRTRAGAGAGGGVAFTLAAMGAHLRSGAEAFCDLIRLGDLLEECDGVVTCEQEFEERSFHGHAAWHAAHMSQLAGRPTLIACATASKAAMEKAGLIGVRVVPLAEDSARDPQRSEMFTRLQGAAGSFARLRR